MEEKKTIEQNFEEIESIIQNMQEEDVTLDKSFELYNKGLNLVKDCNAQIDKIEKQIQIINEEQSC
ncbi:MAG: exodeoxyribonuclease VII small subunit [Eubacterium sp.]|jgi:exodeoxyribonuclease VII small subunit|nr:exodeoxyribonuclease VII small subunit [Eubacterium sp.]